MDNWGGGKEDYLIQRKRKQDKGIKQEKNERRKERTTIMRKNGRKCHVLILW